MMIVKPKTQKARGIIDGLVYLKKTDGKRRLFNNFVHLPDHVLVRKTCDVKERFPTRKSYYGYITYARYPFFARPCPMRPRHGFIESRKVVNKDQLCDLITSVKKCDPDGEVILGPSYNKILYNSIYTNDGNLSIGIGNDGATGGNKSINIPVSPTKFSREFMRRSGINKKESVYLEAIYQQLYGCDSGLWYIVQARGGPKIDSVASDFIPKKMIVRHVVSPHNDLLRWEREASQFKEGTVVYGKGHTLTSHAAIHCVLNNVPFITSRKPLVGETLHPKRRKASTKINRLNFRRGITVGEALCNQYRDSLKKIFYFCISVLHNWPYIRNSQHADWILGVASFVFVKLCYALVKAEHRHLISSNEYRSSVYRRCMESHYSCLNELPSLFSDFHTKHWSSGFGGVPWAICAWHSNQMWKSIVRTYNNRSENLSKGEVSRLISHVNKIVNLAHNNGWWFNKIAEKKDFTSITKYSGLSAFSVADVFFSCYKLFKDTHDVKFSLNKPKPVKKPFLVNRYGKTIWLRKMGSSSNSFVLIVEGGKRIYKTINLSKKERLALSNKYVINGLYPGSISSIYLKRDGSFKLPGGKRMENIKNIFEVDNDKRFIF